MSVERLGSPFLGFPDRNRGLISCTHLSNFDRGAYLKSSVNRRNREVRCERRTPFLAFGNGAFQSSLPKNQVAIFANGQNGIFDSKGSEAWGRLRSKCASEEYVGQGRFTRGFNRLCREGLLFVRCTVFMAVVSGVGILIWLGQMKAREFVEDRLLPAVAASLSDHLQRELDLGKVRQVSPLSISLQSCSIGPHREEFSCADVPLVKVRLRPFASLRMGRIVIDAVLLQPTLLVAQKEDFSWLGIPPSSEKDWKRVTSDEDGIDRRTRIRRAAREEAAADWARERNASARKAAEMGYIATRQRFGSSAEEERNAGPSFLEPTTSGSFFCSDERTPWRDHHCVDTGLGYETKHAGLEKSFRVGSSATGRGFWSQILYDPLGRRFKRRKVRRKKALADYVAVQSKLLERSAAAALAYFGRTDDGSETAYDEALAYASNEGFHGGGPNAKILEKDQKGIKETLASNGSDSNQFSLDENGSNLLVGVHGENGKCNETPLGTSRGIFQNTGEVETPYSKVNCQESGLLLSRKTAEVDKHCMGESTASIRDSAGMDVQKNSNSRSGETVMQSPKSERLGPARLDANRVYFGTRNNIMEESMQDALSGAKGSESHKVPVDLSQGSKLVLANLVSYIEMNRSIYMSELAHKFKLVSWLESALIHISEFLASHAQRVKPYLSAKAESLAADFVEMVDGDEEIAITGVDKLLPVTVDSVYFSGGTLMLLGYGDREPREMENVNGHVQLQNHYGRVHVQLSGYCKEWRTGIPSKGGGWLSADVFVDIIEQKWHANLKISDFFAPLFERILDIPIIFSKGRASGEVHVCMGDGDTFPNLHGQLDVDGLEFQLFDAPACFSDINASLCFRGQRIFLHNTSGWFGDAPLEVTGDFGVNPEDGEFHLMCQLAGSVTAVFNCQGPLDAPVIIGSGMVSRRTGHIGRVPSSLAYEAMLKNKEAGAIAAFDRIPFSYVSANFTFNMDNSVADLYGIRVSLLDGGEIRGAGNAWICPEGEDDDSALDLNWSGSLSFDDVICRYLPAEVQPLPVKIGYINGETKLSGSLLKPRFDIKWAAPNAEESFNDARGDIIIAHEHITVSSSSAAFEIYLKLLTSYPNELLVDQRRPEHLKNPAPPVIDGVELDLRLRGFDIVNLVSSDLFGTPKPLHVKATGRIKLQGLVTRSPNAVDGKGALGSKRNMNGTHVVAEQGPSVLIGDVLLSGIRLNQLMIAPHLVGSVNVSQDNMKLDVSGRPDENLMVEIVGPFLRTKHDDLSKRTMISTSLQKGQLRANVCYRPHYSADLEVRNLPLDELEVASLRGTIQKAELQLNFQKRRGHGSLSVIHPKFSGVQGEALDVSARWSGDVITIEKTVLEQLSSKYELQGEYVLPGTRDRYPAEREADGLMKRAMAGQLGRVISSLGRWRIRLEVPHAEVAEILPLARLLSRSSDPAVRSRSKDLFMQSLQAAGFCAESLNDQLEALHLRYISSDDVSLEDISLPGLSELRGRWRGSLDASGGGNGDTMADFDFHGEDWEWGAYKTQRVLAVGAYNNNDGLRLEKILIQKDNATLHADGNILGPKTNLHFAVLNFPVSLVPALLQVIESSATDAIHSCRAILAPIKGILHMEGDLRGSLAKPECDIQVRLLDGAVGGIDLGRAEVVASLTSTSRFLFSANVEPVIQSGHVHVQGSIPITLFENDSLIEDEIDKESMRTKWFPTWMQEKVKDNSEMVGDKKVTWERNEEGREAYLTEHFKGLNWNISDVSEVKVDADIKDGGMMLITALFPYADWLHGSADIDLQVRGTIEQPVLDGTASFHRASVSSPVLPKPLSNFGGTVNFKSNRLSINVLESRVGRKGRLVVKGNLPLKASELFPGDKIDLKCEVLEVRAKNVFSGQVDSQIQVTGSILQPDVSGMIKLSHGEAYLPHDKGAGATVNRLTANRSSLASSIYSRLASSGHVSRFFGSLSTGPSKVPQPAEKSDEVGQKESVKTKPRLNVHLSDLKLHLGPELKIVYPLILNFAASGELELNGLADPKWIKPRGVLTFENGEVNLVATQVRLKRDHQNIAKFEPDQGLDPTLDLALVGSEWQLRIQSRASNWQDNLVVTSTRSVEQDVLSPTELAFKKLAAATLETLMPRIEGKGEFGQARWRLVYAPQIPSLLSLDPTIDPLKSLANSISFGTEVEVQLGKRLQASVVRQMKDSEMAMQWTLLYQLTSRLRILFQSSPSWRLLCEYSATSQD
ncbi:hypothetical protein EJ110_NYTH39403 [Nymphaea thermarum]|nr:hypothetical protein EJ110_NYTH39403 [Nymphaea thermarum]